MDCFCEYQACTRPGCQSLLAQLEEPTKAFRKFNPPQPIAKDDLKRLEQNRQRRKLEAQREHEESLDYFWSLVRPTPGGRGNTVSLRGRVFGRLTVLGLAGKDKRGSSLWRCRCECGNEKVVPRGRLRDGRVKSCGCLLREYKASPKPALSQRPRPETDLTIITHAGDGRRRTAVEITCRIIRLGDDVEVVLVVPTWVSHGQYGIEGSTLEALADGEYLAEWTYRLTREGTAYRTERAFSIEDGIVIDRS